VKVCESVRVKVCVKVCASKKCESVKVRERERERESTRKAQRRYMGQPTQEACNLTLVVSRRGPASSIVDGTAMGFDFAC